MPGPVFDVRCDRCETVVEVFKAFKDEYPCPHCQSPTTTLMPTPHVAMTEAELDPHNQRQGSAPIKSFGNDRRKGGKGYGPG